MKTQQNSNETNPLNGLKLFTVGVLATSLFMFGCGSTHEHSQLLNTADKNAIIGGREVQTDDPISKSIVLLLVVEIDPTTKEEQQGICTGSIISENIILTAAHCIPAQGGAMLAIFGKDIKNPEKVIPVIGMVVNSQFADHEQRDSNWGDIALVRIKENIPQGYKPISILSDSTALKIGNPVILAGYGKSSVLPDLSNAKTAAPATSTPPAVSAPAAQSVEPDDGTGVLRKTSVNIYESNYGGSEVVLDQRKGTGACNGDSGGPAYMLVNGQLQLFGITSRGNLSCDSFAIYTNVLAHQKFVEIATAKLNAISQEVPSPKTR